MKIEGEKNKAAKLYMVATPIGNMNDLSAHAKTVLAQADVLICENPSHSQKLWASIGPMRYQQIEKLTEHVSRDQIEKWMLEWKEKGFNICYLSDAGTPCVCDPGAVLVDVAYGLKISIGGVCGPCAAVFALSVCGWRVEKFTFHGFLQKAPAEKKKALEKMQTTDGYHVFYESPHRLLKTLVLMKEVFGAEHEVCMVKEISKVYERIRRCGIGEMIKEAEQRGVRGEYVLVLPAGENINTLRTQKEWLKVDAMIDVGKKNGLSVVGLCEMIKAAVPMGKKEIYNHVLSRLK